MINFLIQASQTLQGAKNPIYLAGGGEMCLQSEANDNVEG